MKSSASSSASRSASGGPFGADNRPLLIFSCKYLVLVIGLSTLSLSDTFASVVGQPLSALAAASSAWVLGVAGYNASSFGTVLMRGVSALEVKNGCNGVEVLFILLPAFLAAPRSWRAKVIGVLLAVLGTYVLNVARVVTLSELLVRMPNLFAVAHIYVWQVGIILAGLAYWLYWVEHFADARA